MVFNSDFIFARCALAHIVERNFKRCGTANIEAKNSTLETSSAPVPTFQTQFFFNNVMFVIVFKELWNFLLILCKQIYVALV